MACDRFRQPTQDHNVGYVKNTYLQPLVVGEYQCKGAVKFNMSVQVSGVSFGQFRSFQ